jgi:hypothetical protein
MLPGDEVEGNNATSIFVVITADVEPPAISDVTLTYSDPKDIDPTYGWENFTCTVTDDVGLDTVQINITHPDAHTDYITMTKAGDTYYYETTFTVPGGINLPGYTYNIYATDTFGKESTSTPVEFDIPMNEDINEDGQILFSDIMGVAGEWLWTGDDGAIRADVNNDGSVLFSDIMAVAGQWLAQW